MFELFTASSCTTHTTKLTIGMPETERRGFLDGLYEEDGAVRVNELFSMLERVDVEKAEASVEEDGANVRRVVEESTDEIQSSSLSDVELNQQIISDTISGIEDNIPNEVNYPHDIEPVGTAVATLKESGASAIDCQNSHPSCLPHSLRLQWDDLGGPDTLANDCTNVGDTSRSSITSENQAELEGIVNLSLQLEIGGGRYDRQKRRVSLVNLATINSLYDLDYLDSDSTDDI